jgi:hypothetical protein
LFIFRFSSFFDAFCGCINAAALLNSFNEMIWFDAFRNRELDGCGPMTLFRPICTMFGELE